MEEALEAYRRARAARPDYAPALCGEALALRNLGHYGEALAAFEAAEALGSGEAVAGKGCLLLTLGDFERGFEGYEARWLTGKSLTEALGTRYPTWAGPGKGQDRVLVLNDHGLGDTIQFVRYLPRMAAAGVEATFVCPSKLHRLLKATMPSRLVEAPPDEPFDAQIAVSSLPARLPHPARHGSGRRSLSCRRAGPFREVGRADRRRRIQDRRRLAGQPPSRGGSGALLSAGGGGGAGVAPRRPPRRAAKGLWRRADRRPSARDEGRNAGRGIRFGPDAFVDAAAVMTHCDLVVTCDTSIAHLAGALARPVWVALKSDAEWRWMIERDNSPWYPTMRLSVSRDAAPGRRCSRRWRAHCRRRLPPAARCRPCARPVRSAT